ncbi:MAG TPA: chemotaxis protein CheD [Verrucomicrobiae bacterium]|nr:chemotaxis protein CheD [Verrucomicrobiae bacterium]
MAGPRSFLFVGEIEIELKFSPDPPILGWIVLMSSNGPWVIPQRKKTLIVGVADMIASNDATAELVTYSLGSCLGVAIYDPVAKVGGLLHAMLPDSTIDANKAVSHPLMFIDTGIPHLFRTVYGLGGVKGRLTVRVAGGAEFLDSEGFFNIGARNIKSLQSLLQKNGHRIDAAAMGGRCSRTVKLEMSSGRFTIQSPGEDPKLL